MKLVNKIVCGLLMALTLCGSVAFAQTMQPKLMNTHIVGHNLVNITPVGAPAGTPAKKHKKKHRHHRGNHHRHKGASNAAMMGTLAPKP